MQSWYKGSNPVLSKCLGEARWQENLAEVIIGGWGGAASGGNQQKHWENIYPSHRGAIYIVLNQDCLLYVNILDI